MSKFTLAVIVLVLALGAGVYWFVGRNVGEPSSGTQSAAARYFKERIIARGVASIGQPIEGFDSALLLLSFPGLTESDFNEVQTFEGRYQWNGSTLSFVRSVTQPISSAERTVSDEGYATLLANLTRRLGVTAQNEAELDALIERIGSSERLRLRINESGSAYGVTITPRVVVEDSRCPAEVACIQAGTVRLKALLASGLGEAEQEFKIGEPITTEVEQLTLVTVEPAPRAGAALVPSEYFFTFEISKR